MLDIEVDAIRRVFLAHMQDPHTGIALARSRGRSVALSYMNASFLQVTPGGTI